MSADETDADQPTDQSVVPSCWLMVLHTQYNQNDTHTIGRSVHTVAIVCGLSCQYHTINFTGPRPTCSCWTSQCMGPADKTITLWAYWLNVKHRHIYSVGRRLLACWEHGFFNISCMYLSCYLTEWAPRGGIFQESMAQREPIDAWGVETSFQSILLMGWSDPDCREEGEGQDKFEAEARS
jgi:hypothetical protein